IHGAIEPAAGQVRTDDRRNGIRANAADTRSRGDKDNVVVGGAYQNPGDGASGEDVCAGSIEIKRAKQRGRGFSVLDDVQAHPEEAVCGKIAFSSAHEDGGGIQWIDGDGAYGKRLRVVHQGRPCGTAVQGSVESALGCAHVDNVLVGRIDRDRRYTT